MGTLMSVPCDLNCPTLYNIKEINSSFATGSLKVMYLGDNRNGSHFSKDAVDKALPSLMNVPIVCRWDDEAEEIGGHDIAVVSDGDGGLRIKNLTEPCGVVPDHARFSYKKECDSSGNEHEYLVIDGVILWKRQDVYRHILNDLDGKVKHSMEINVLDGGKNTDGYYDVTRFEFTALCLLGNCEPCFQGSELELYSAQNFKQKMEQMMRELKESIDLIDTSFEVDDIHPQNYSMEGGETVLEDKKDLLAKYDIDANSLDFSIDDFTIEELIEKFEAMKKNESNEDDDSANKENEQDKFALTQNVVDELYRVLSEETTQREWGECPRYWYVDCDFDVLEVYCIDTEDWLLYGFTYAIDGDSITIDYESKKRKKYVIADFDGGDQPSPFAQAFELMEKKLHDNVEWEAKYQNASDTIASMENELGELRRFKTDTETAIAKDERDKVFARFEDLVGVEAFENLREHCMDYDTETLEEKCYAIRGRSGAAAKFNLDNKTPKIPIEKIEENTDDDEPYGGLMSKYNVARN